MNLAQLTKIVADEDLARELLEKMRWNGNAVCPHCDAEKAYQLTPKEGSKTRKGLWKCRVCRKQFTVTVGTIFEGSRIPISKWLMALHLICSSKKGISALQLSRNLGLTYKSAWFMAHRIRYGMSQEPLRTKLKGTVEADETYIGGKAKNMHKAERIRAMEGRKGGTHSKAPVVTLVERDGRVKTHHMEHVTGVNIKRVMRECITPDNAFLMTDEAYPYNGANRMFLGHATVNHSEKEYVRGTGAGAVHCNTAESVHALLKRGVVGVYHHWSKKHLHRYLAEFDFRWNTRKITDGERMAEAVTMVGGKRLKYSDPIKKH
ncbi:MAG: IS1595 family transposase [Pyrinomonadaceae bacterium]